MKPSKPIVFRHGNDGLSDVVSVETGSDFSEFPCMTVQADVDEADINVLVKRFGLTGTMPAARSRPEYGDFSGITDYQSALNELNKLDESFAQLPAATRARFQNDPGELLRFVNDDANLEEARKLGLLKPEEPIPAPIRVVVDNPAPAPPAA